MLEQAHPIANVKMCTQKLHSPLMAGCRAWEARTLAVSAETAVGYADVLGKIWLEADCHRSDRLGCGADRD